MVRNYFPIHQLQIDCLLKVRRRFLILRQLTHPVHYRSQGTTFIQSFALLQPHVLPIYQSFERFGVVDPLQRTQPIADRIYVERF